MTSTLSAVIPTFCRYEALRKTVEDLLRQTTPPIEIVIADSTPEAMRAEPDWTGEDASIRYLSSPTAGNANATRNAALRRATGDYVLLLDDDLSIPEDCVAAFLRVHAEGWDAVHGNLTEGGASLQIPTTQRGNRPFWRTVRHRHGESRAHTVAVSSGFTSVRRSVLESLGLLDERLAFHYDDYDLGYRLWCAGATLIHDPRPRADHVRSAEGREHRTADPHGGLAAKYYFLRKHFTRRAVRVELVTDLLLTFWDQWKRPWRMFPAIVRHWRAYRAGRRLSES